MKHRTESNRLGNLRDWLVLVISFVGHSLSVFASSCRYFRNKIIQNKKALPSTNVDELIYSFREGIGQIYQYIRKHPVFLIVAPMCVDRVFFLLTQRGLRLIISWTYAFLVFCPVLTPFLLTPSLFSGLLRRLHSMLIMEESVMKKEENGNEILQDMLIKNTSPHVIQKESPIGNKDVNLFLNDYRETLLASLELEGMPSEIWNYYDIESCLRKDLDSKKELYLLNRKKDGKKVLLRITTNYPEEDALEESRILNRLHHPGIPKVILSFEKNGRSYLIREYIEGRTLEDVVISRGCLCTEDIFTIAKKLAEILKYIHTQTPPVIHRDIKPQNIVLGLDGSIHLIDFGIAREHKWQRRHDTSVVLTLDYASPEQYGFEQTTPLSDIYSLGVVLLYLATGGIVRSMIEAQITDNRLKELIERCVAFNPEDRFQSAHQLMSFIHGKKRQKTVLKQRQFPFSVGILAGSFFLSCVSYAIGYGFVKQDISNQSYKKGYENGYTDGYETAPKMSGTIFDESRFEGTDASSMSIGRGTFAVRQEESVFCLTDEGIMNMPHSGTNSSYFTMDTNLHALSYRNEWLYYSSDEGIMQMNIYTLEKDKLFEIQGKLYVFDPYFYVKTENGLFLLDLDSHQIVPIENAADCISLYTDGNHLYFINNSDHGLYRCDLLGGQRTQLLEEYCTSMCFFEEDILCVIHQEGEQKIIRYSLKTGETELFLLISADMLQSYGEGICFLDKNDQKIYRCSADGRIRERISLNSAIDFNVAGGWIFYHNLDDKGELWCVRLDGANDHPVIRS